MKTFQWHFSTDSINWSELSHLYLIAPLGEKTESNLSIVFGNSRYVCFVYHNQMLIGAGRVLADGVDCAYICDIAIHPDYQGEGLGKSIVAKLTALSRDHNKIILYANPGKESFYNRLGFKNMNTAMAIFSDQKQAMDIGLISQE